MLDLILAIAHHLVVFALFGVLIAELVLVHRTMSAELVTKIGRIDNWYGILAGTILVVGFSRAIFAAKGWNYYEHNGFFWAKIVTFVIIALLSVPPTVRFIQWRLNGVVPDDNAIRNVQKWLYAEVALFPLLLVFAAAMARGFGEF